jgi:hypothetical protein
MSDTNDVPMPDKAKLIAALEKSAGSRPLPDWNEIEEAARWALHAVGPDGEFLDLTMRNPVSRVMFRAGLIACREYMARFVEQGGNPDIAASIRANWWPVLGADPGPPRLLDFGEIADEITEVDKVSYWSKPVTASQEALPCAFQFLGSAG